MTELLPAPATPQTIDFGPLTIAYDERVLTPRPWTVLQSHWARELLDTAPPGPVLELCSGAGHIGLLAVHGTDRRLVCVDTDPIACDYARENAEVAGLGARVAVHQSALSSFDADHGFGLIIADPPWVLSEHVTCFPADPVLAIDGGPDGLEVARECLAVIDRLLLPGGSALLQLGSVAQTGAIGDELPPGLRAAEVRAEPGHGLVVRLVRS